MPKIVKGSAFDPNYVSVIPVEKPKPKPPAPRPHQRIQPVSKGAKNVKRKAG